MTDEQLAFVCWKDLQDLSARLVSFADRLERNAREARAFASLPSIPDTHREQMEARARRDDRARDCVRVAAVMLRRYVAPQDLGQDRSDWLRIATPPDHAHDLLEEELRWSVLHALANPRVLAEDS